MNRAVVLAMAVAGACAGSLACSSAFAQGVENDEGFYIGGGVGQFNVQIDDVDETDEAIETLDDDDTAWKAFVGWRMNPYFALELAYVDFGGPSDRFDGAGCERRLQRRHQRLRAVPHRHDPARTGRAVR